MKYLATLILACVFFVQVQAQTETSIIENASINGHTIEQESQSIIDQYIYQYDTTFATPPDTGIVSIDTALIDSIMKNQYRFSVDVGGFGTFVKLTWRDSLDHIDFANGILRDKLRATAKVGNIYMKNLYEAIDIFQAVTQNYFTWAQNQCGGCINGAYTMTYNDQTGPVTISGKDIFDTGGTWAGAGADIGNIRYFTASDGLMYQVVFADGESVILFRQPGRALIRSLDDENQKVIIQKN